MGWNKREPVSNLVVLGDDEGQTEKVAGLLMSTKQDNMYPARMNYELVQKSGESIWLAGSASIGRQLGPTDVGKFVKCRFTGWGKSKNGKFKEIEVIVWDGEVTADMKAWPRWAEVAKNPGAAGVPTAPVEDYPEQAPDDDDLPF